MVSPNLNLVVIRTKDLDRAKSFYELLGMTFERHAHGNGPEHLSFENRSIVFELYPHVEGQPTTESTRIGFSVPDVDKVVARITAVGGVVHRQPKDSPWGRRAVVRDFDNHFVELTNSDTTTVR